MKSNRFIRSVAGFSVSSIAAFIIGFVSTPIMTRLYPPEQLSGTSMFLSALGVILVIVYVGQDQSFARFYHDVDDKGDLLGTNLIIITASWLITFVFSLLFVRLLSEVIYSEVNYLATILCAYSSLPMTILRMSSQLYRMQSKTKAYVIQSIVINFATKIFVILAAFISPDYNLYIIAYAVVSTVLAIVFMIVQMRHNEIRIRMHTNKKNISTQLQFGIPLMIAAFGYQLFTFIPRAVLLNSPSGQFEGGIYAAAISLASSINIVQAGFQTYFGAYVYESYKNDSGQINRIHHSIVFISASAIMLLTVFSGLIVSLLGSEYASSRLVFPILLIPPVLINLSETVVYGINLSNNTLLHIIIAFASAVVVFVFSYLLVPGIGAIGAAIAYAIASFVFYLLRSYWGIRYLNVVHDRWITYVSIMFMMFVPLISWLLDTNATSKYIAIFAAYLVLVILYCIKYRSFIGKTIRKKVDTH